MKTSKVVRPKDQPPRFSSLPLWQKISVIGIPLAAILVPVLGRQSSSAKDETVGSGTTNYVLGANMLVNNSNVYLRQLNFQGDVNFTDAKDSIITHSVVSADTDHNSGGNLNINRSRNVRADGSIIKKDVNIDDSDWIVVTNSIIGAGR